MLEQTRQEQQRYLYWHRKKNQRVTPRALLRESDELMYWLEECIEREMKIVPGWLLPRLVTLLGNADRQLPQDLGRERRPLQVMEYLFQAQEVLMGESVHGRGPGRVIPLFKRARTAMPELDDHSEASALPRA
jgi:hypothetical protein